MGNNSRKSAKRKKAIAPSCRRAKELESTSRRRQLHRQGISCDAFVTLHQGRIASRGYSVSALYLCVCLCFASYCSSSTLIGYVPYFCRSTFLVEQEYVIPSP